MNTIVGHLCGLCPEYHNELSFQGQLACPDFQVSKVPKAEREMLGFQGSQAHLVTPVKEVLQGSQGNQGSPGLQAVQVSIGRCQELRQVWDVPTYKEITSVVFLWVLTGARLLGQGNYYSQHSK